MTTLPPLSHDPGQLLLPARSSLLVCLVAPQDKKLGAALPRLEAMLQQAACTMPSLLAAVGDCLLQLVLSSLDAGPAQTHATSLDDLEYHSQIQAVGTGLHVPTK